MTLPFFFLVFFVIKHAEVSCFDFIFHLMSLGIHTYSSVLPKVLQKNHIFKKKERKKILQNCLSICNLVENVEVIVPKFPSCESDLVNKRNIS